MEPGLYSSSGLDRVDMISMINAVQCAGVVYVASCLYSKTFILSFKLVAMIAIYYLQILTLFCHAVVGRMGRASSLCLEAFSRVFLFVICCLVEPQKRPFCVIVFCGFLCPRVELCANFMLRLAWWVVLESSHVPPFALFLHFKGSNDHI